MQPSIDSIPYPSWRRYSLLSSHYLHHIPQNKSGSFGRFFFGLQQSQQASNNQRHIAHPAKGSQGRRRRSNVGVAARHLGSNGVHVGKANVGRVEAVCLVDLADLGVAGVGKDDVDALQSPS